MFKLRKISGTQNAWITQRAPAYLPPSLRNTISYYKRTVQNPMEALPHHTPFPSRGNYYLEFKAYYTHAWPLAFIHRYVFLNNIQQFSTYLSMGTWIASNLSLLQVIFPYYKRHCSGILVPLSGHMCWSFSLAVSQRITWGTFKDIPLLGLDPSVVQWLRLCTSGGGGLGSIPSQGARSHMLQLRPGTAR